MIQPIFDNINIWIQEEDPNLSTDDVIWTWIYAPELAVFGFEGVKSEPKFDNPAYISNFSFNMTEALFGTLYDSIFITEIVTKDYEGEEYWLYSQAVPKSATSRDQIDYYIFRMVKAQSF